VHVRRSLTLLSAALALLFGCGGDSGGGGSATISGKVVDDIGQPLANRTVLIGSISTTTDSSGAFTLKGVATPYDLTILAPAPTKFASIYTGLTRTDPTVPDLSVTDSPTMNATIKGTLSGGDPFPTAPDVVTVVTWGSMDQAFGGDFATTSSYSFDVLWSSPATITGSVHALQWKIDDNSTVTDYVAHGSKSGVSLTNAATVNGTDLSLTAPTIDSVSVTATPPPGHEIFARNVVLGWDDGAFIQVSGDRLDGGVLEVPVPSNIGAKALVQFRSVSGDLSMESDAQLTRLSPGTTGATVSLPPPAHLTTPANNATGVDTSTDFVWTPVSSAFHVLFLEGSANDPGYGIVSAGTRVRIPDLSAHGLGLPSGHNYDAILVAFGPYASLDAFAATGLLPKEGPDFRTVSFTGFTTH